MQADTMMDGRSKGIIMARNVTAAHASKKCIYRRYLAVADGCIWLDGSALYAWRTQIEFSHTFLSPHRLSPDTQLACGTHAVKTKQLYIISIGQE